MYQRTVRGPNLNRAFRVTGGLVVVVGQDDGVTLCPGALWPGLGSLPAHIVAHLSPRRSLQTEFTEVEYVEPAQQEAAMAAAFIAGQLLRSSSAPLRERMRRLEALVPLAEMSRETSAALLGANRTAIWRESQLLGGSP